MFTFWTILVVTWLAMISPGPDSILIFRNSLSHVQKAGIFTALGIAFGTVIHSFCCILGLSVMILKSQLLFNIIRYAGGIYIIYLGIKTIISKFHYQATLLQPDISITSTKAFIQGALCNILNPSMIIFSIAMFSSIIKPTLPVYHQALYAVEIFMLHFIWFAFVVTIISNANDKLINSKIIDYTLKVLGVFLILFGLKITVNY